MDPTDPQKPNTQETVNMLSAHNSPYVWKLIAWCLKIHMCPGGTDAYHGIAYIEIFQPLTDECEYMTLVPCINGTKLFKLIATK